MTAQDIAQYITTGLDIYGKYKEITEYPAYAQEAEALRIQLAQAEAEAAKAKATQLKNVLIYGGIGVATLITVVLVLRKRKK